MTSQARPIHQPPREIRHTPAETEPSYSFEQESFLPKSEEDVEDEIHRRLTGTNKNFRRGGGEGPSLRSMSMKQQQQERGASGDTEESAGSRPVVTVGSPPKASSVSENTVSRGCGIRGILVSLH